jgi:hypothetical protein
MEMAWKGGEPKEKYNKKVHCRKEAHIVVWRLICVLPGETDPLSFDNYPALANLYANLTSYIHYHGEENVQEIALHASGCSDGS